MKRLYVLFSTAFALCLFTIATQAQTSVWATYFGKGVEAYEKGDLATAEKFLRAALAEAESAVKTGEEKANGMLCDTLGTLSVILGEQGKYVEAEDFARRALKLAGLVYEESDEPYSKALNNLGLALTNQKKYSEAEAIHRQVMKTREKYEPAPKYNLMVSVLNLGLVYFEQKKYFEAKALFNQVVDFHLSLVRNGDWKASQENKSVLLTAMNDAALSEEKLGEINEAKKHFEAIVIFVEAIDGKDSPSLIGHLENYARVLRQKKETISVTHIENRIKAIKRLNKIQG